MKAVIIGSGNVATNLARALTAAGVEIIQVYSHTLGNAAALAGKRYRQIKNGSLRQRRTHHNPCPHRHCLGGSGSFHRL